MYWEGVKADYHVGKNESVVMITSVRKSIVEYGNEIMRYSLRCNCTPDVAINRIRKFPVKFKEKTGFELIGNGRVMEDEDKNIYTFLGTVKNGNVVMDLPVVIGKNKLFDDVKAEILFQMRYVNDPGKGKYAYYNGTDTLFFDSFEELIGEVIKSADWPVKKEYFGDEFVRLFPGARTYFRDYGRSTLFVVNDSSVIVYAPGETVSMVEVDDPINEYRNVKKILGGHPAGVLFFGSDVRRGKYYVKSGKYWVMKDVKRGDDYWEEFLDAGDDYGARAGLVSGDGGVLVFDDFIVVGLKKLGILQKVRMKRPGTKYGTLYRYFYFAPYADSFDVQVLGDLGVSMYVLLEEIDMKII